MVLNVNPGRNLKLTMEYEGTNYHGWQRQENALSVQEALEDAIFKLAQEKVNVISAGRTDSGVHARGQVVNFRLNKQLPLERIRMGLNSYLPDDIIIKEISNVPDNFHARFDARRRVYQYFIILGKTAVHRNFCWQFFQKLDESLLQPMANLLVGENDFAAFSRMETDTEHKICTVFESFWKEEGNFLIYRIVANRFLRGMVRTIVGTMIDVARGRFSAGRFEKIFASGDRNLAGTTAPAKGLFLEEVIY